MQKKILIYMFVVSLCGVILVSTAMYVIQTFMAQNTADDTMSIRLTDVTERIRHNEIRINELISALKEDYLSRARSFAMMIELEPEIIKNRDKLNEVANILDVDELHVIDGNGILWWGTQPEYYGMDFNTSDQTRPFLAILDEPKLEIAQDPMPNGFAGIMRQYAGVSLHNTKGIAQVGMIPERVDEALKNNKICNVLNDVIIGNTGYVFSILIETGLISSHPNTQLIGTMPVESLKETGFMSIDGQRVMYRTLSFDGQMLVAVMPVNELYAGRSFYNSIFAIFIILVFGAFYGIVNLYIKRNVISGITSIIHTMEEISSGNYNAIAQVSSCKEFEKLSEGISNMLFNIKHKMGEIAELSEVKERFGVIISSACAGVIIKDKNGVISDWNAGAEHILGYSQDEVIGHTEELYAYIPKLEELRDLNKRCLNGENIPHAETWVVDKAGNVVVCSTSISPIININNEVAGLVLVFHDITAEKSIELKDKKLAAIVAIADAGIIIKDMDGIVQEWNIGAKNILGYEPEEMVGKSTKYYAPEEGHAAIDEIERRLPEGIHTTHAEVIRKHKDGRLIDCSASYTPIFDDDGSFIGSVAIFHDISDKKQAERSLKDALNAAEEASHAKSTFLANMSHEIRTPMNGVIGFTDLALDDEEISNNTKNYLIKIRESAAGMIGIINDILDISKIEAGKVEIERIPFNFHEILKQCEAINSIKANEKGILLYFCSEPYIHGKIIGDPTRLRQVLLNLLSNAIKFTNKGTVRMTASAEQIDKNRIKIYFEVNDSGIGMTNDQIEKIFEPFTQADSSTTRKYGGTGLGLTITKNMIELMGGELKVESLKGIGSRFSFSLIFETVDAIDGSLNDKAEHTGEIMKPVFSGDILVCEDNLINQQVIREHLLRVGIEAVIVENGKLGIDEVKARINDNKKFDIILMDIHMPVMDGLEASRILADMGCKIPIVALTANIMSEDKVNYLANGITDYLVKPFTSQQLWKCLLKYLDPVNRSVMKSTGTQINDFNKNIIIDRAAGIERAAGNEELYINLLSDFLYDNRYKLRIFSEAANAGNIKLAHRLIHTLKSTSATIGAERLSKAASDVENSVLKGILTFPDEQMKRLKDELNAVLKIIAEAEDTVVLNKIANKDVDNKKILSLINDLIPLLESGSTACMERISEIKDVILPFGELAHILISQIEDYEFELALEVIKSIKEIVESKK